MEKPSLESIFNRPQKRPLGEIFGTTKVAPTPVSTDTPGMQGKFRNEAVNQETSQDIKQFGTDVVDSLKARNLKIEANKARNAVFNQQPKDSVAPLSVVTNAGNATKKFSLNPDRPDNQTNARTGIQNLGQVLGFGADVIGAGIEGGVKAVLPQKNEEKVKENLALLYDNPIVKPLVDKIPVEELSAKYEQWKLDNPNKAADLDATAAFLEFASNFVGAEGLSAGTKAVAPIIDDVAKQTTKQVLNATGDVVTTGAGMVDNLGTSITKAATETADLAKKKLGPPEPTLEHAVGQVVQGKSTDVAKAQKAIQSIDTKDVKTYKDLANKLQEKKKDLVNTVDNELAKDSTIYPIDSLATSATTKSGKVVSTNHVTKSLSDLKEYYKTVGDVVKESEIDDLIAKNAFTRKEVNDISRIYSEEFGTKAFGKTGEPLTSVNAQAYENTRKGLKDVARQGIGGKEAKLADEALSAIYNTEKLVKRNIEAVNKLQQRINERGLLEKAGNVVAKYGDILTGGTIRGIVGGLLPRGAGYKVLNALDLEEQLAKNLAIINKAMTAKSDDALVKTIKKLESSTKNK